MSRILVLRPPAKINLTLRVGPPRGDGFHDVRTLLQSVALSDTLTVTARRGPFALAAGGPGVPTDETNLVSRAAAALWRALGRDGEPRDAHVKLVKQIPLAAGLGGGSADAAAALVALNVRVGRAAVAARPGADWRHARRRRALLSAGRHRARGGPRRRDLSGRRCRAIGRRHHQAVIRRRDGRRVPLARRGPRGRRRGRGRRRRAMSTSAGRPGPSPWSTTCRRRWRGATRPSPTSSTTLAKAGALGAAMTGSGSAVFGLFPEAQAPRAARRLKRADWLVQVTRTLSRREAARRMGL